MVVPYSVRFSHLRSALSRDLVVNSYCLYSRFHRRYGWPFWPENCGAPCQARVGSWELMLLAGEAGGTAPSARDAGGLGGGPAALSITPGAGVCCSSPSKSGLSRGTGPQVRTDNRVWCRCGRSVVIRVGGLRCFVRESSWANTRLARNTRELGSCFARTRCHTDRVLCS